MSQIEETKTAMDLIYLVSCAVNNVIPDAQRCGEMDDEAVYSLANRHMLSAAAAFALKKVMPLPNHWHNAIGNSMRRLVIYHAERSKILREFDERGIRYLPLKGIILKGIYPKPEMREMSDN
ncbi:MAG: nucleotidyltransferase family protein, partial [Ruminococcus sp.]|nr:nucleotidyltransferase family protein [Ruminococcus sp.]